MSNTEALAPHLPYLRRYARALTGSQSSGDRYVRAALNAILTGEQALTPSIAPRLALYQLFHGSWLSAAGHVDDEIDRGSRSSTTIADKRLAMLDAEQRAILLLTAVEGFKTDEAAVIVGGTPHEVELALVEVEGSIDRQLKARVMIIEDEPIIAMDLERIIADMGHEVVGIAATREQAVSTALEKRPGLILADVNLGEGGSGIDAVKQILDSFDVPIIFVTAYPEKLLTGERIEPAYLVAKPFLPESIRATVGQALFFHQPREASS